jgi:hypothetical protein
MRKLDKIISDLSAEERKRLMETCRGMNEVMKKYYSI